MVAITPVFQRFTQRTVQVRDNLGTSTVLLLLKKNYTSAKNNINMAWSHLHTVSASLSWPC